MAGLAEVAADADAPDEAVPAGADDEDTVLAGARDGLAGAEDGFAGAEDEQAPIAIAATRQAQRSHRRPDISFSISRIGSLGACSAIDTPASMVPAGAG